MIYGLPTFNVFSNYNFSLDSNLNLLFVDHLITTDNVLSILQLEEHQSFILELNGELYFKGFQSKRIKFIKFEDHILMVILDCDQDIVRRSYTTPITVNAISFEDCTYKISHNKLIVFNKMLEIASSGLF